MASIEESELYDRQIRLWGQEAQQRLQSSRVLLCGIAGLGAEVVKNLTLAGISATIVDDAVVTAEDLSANFFLAESDIGANRATASLPRIRELNVYVTVESSSEPLHALSEDVIAAHNLVIVTRAPVAQRLSLNSFCRDRGIAFYSAETFGSEGLLFVDLGSHTYRTESGTGEKMKLSDPIVATFPSLQEATAVPWMQLGDKRFGPISSIYVHARILSEFSDTHGGRAASAEDAEAVLEIGERLWELEGRGGQFGRDEARHLATCAQADLAPVCAILGGVIGQEAVKYISGKGKPIQNIFALNALRGEGRTFHSPPLKKK